MPARLLYGESLTETDLNPFDRRRSQETVACRPSRQKMAQTHQQNGEFLQRVLSGTEDWADEIFDLAL